ncbi:MAG: hypothetical protein LC797_08405 [Chloroflexi bacterium]|nr:hypothetical protein [Chloroflexota bacterium]
MRVVMLGQPVARTRIAEPIGQTRQLDRRGEGSRRRRAIGDGRLVQHAEAQGGRDRLLSCHLTPSPRASHGRGALDALVAGGVAAPKRTGGRNLNC